MFFLFFIFFGITIKNFYSPRIMRQKPKLKKNFYILLFLSLLFSVIWFLKFPLYRYGQSFLAIFFILILYLFFFKFLDIKNKNSFKKIYIIIISFALILLCLKNFSRINNISLQNYNHYPWPKIYTMGETDNNLEKKFRLIAINNEKLYFYSDGVMCMYSKSPCSNYRLHDLRIKKVFNYLVYFLKKN
jgi:hypothetical protein